MAITAEEDIYYNLTTADLVKIGQVAMYSTSMEVSQDDKEASLSIINDIYQYTTGQNLIPDNSILGFTDFNVNSGTTSLTGFLDLNFDNNSGFSVKRNPNNKLELVVNHDGFKNIRVHKDNSVEELSARQADSLNIIAEGLEIYTIENQFGEKFLYIKNPYTTIASMEDTGLDLTKEDELLQVNDKKITTTNTVDGGSF